MPQMQHTAVSAPSCIPVSGLASLTLREGSSGVCLRPASRFHDTIKASRCVGRHVVARHRRLVALNGADRSPVRQVVWALNLIGGSDFACELEGNAGPRAGWLQQKKRI